MRILVAYETAHGSTAETAEAVAEVLRERGAHVDVMRCRTVRSVEGYDAFVVGAPIWAGNWLKPARAFVRRHEATLAAHPTAWFFASGAGGTQEREKVEQEVTPRLREYAPMVTPVAVGSFAGVIDYAKYNFILRAMMRALAKKEGNPTEGRHDMRDWERIKAWAAEVHEQFAARLPAG
ncbi:MAG: flavodoxin domain-containing protein [Armatimonadota bacterium]